MMRFYLNSLFKRMIQVIVLIITLILICVVNYNTVEYTDLDKNPFIIDLDFCTDVDDACAVRVATTLDKMGVIDLKAMMLCTTGENNIEALNGLLNYDGYSYIKIGLSAVDMPETSPYWNTLAKYRAPKISTVPSTKLYRQILINCKEPVTIVTTGYLTNIAELFKSKTDNISDKSGIELVNENVRAIYVTGGSYPDGYDNNFFFRKEAIDAAIYINDNCEVPLYYISSNNGAPFKCGGLLQAIDVNRVDPLSKALDMYGTLDGRAAWDPLSIWIAAYTPEETRVVTERVNLEIDQSTGFNVFYTDNENGKHFRINRVDDNLIWYKQSLDALTVYDFDYTGEKQKKFSEKEIKHE